MERIAKAEWRGGLKNGNGRLSTPSSGALSDTAYSFATRFENRTGTNPEELIGAAHAGCFSMALSGQLEKEFGLTAEELRTTATVKLEQTAEGWSVTTIHLDVTGTVPNCDSDTFQKAAAQAKRDCPISRLLKATITMTASLKQGRQAA